MQFCIMYGCLMKGEVKEEKNTRKFVSLMYVSLYVRRIVRLFLKVAPVTVFILLFFFFLNQKKNIVLHKKV